MSDQQHFDDLFKKEFEDYAPPVPQGTFERIIEERKKRRGAIIWWRDWRNLKFLLVFIIATSIGAGGFLFLKDEKQGTVISAQTSQLPTSKESPVKKEEVTINQTVEGENSPATANPTTIISDDGGSSKSSTQLQPSNIEKGNTTDRNYSLKQPAPTALTSSFADKISAGKYKKATFKTSVKASASNIETATADDGTTEDGTSATSVADESKQVSTLQKLPFSLSLITAASLADSNRAVVSNTIKGPDCPEAEKNAAGNKTYWEAYTSADYASKKYMDTANSMFAAKRKETTSFHSAFSFGIRVTKVFNNGASVRTGLNFSQVNEKFSFVQSNTVQTTYIIDAVTGDTTGSYIVRGTKYKTAFNRYRTLDIPLVIGYEVGNGRLHANLNAGAIVNLYSWQKGELLDTAFQPVSITTGKGLPEFQYKTNIGVGFTAGASVYYKLNDRLHLLAEPYFRYNFSPMNKGVFSLQERFTTIGLRLGVRVDF